MDVIVNVRNFLIILTLTAPISDMKLDCEMALIYMHKFKRKISIDNTIVNVKGKPSDCRVKITNCLINSNDNHSPSDNNTCNTYVISEVIHQVGTTPSEWRCVWRHGV